MTGNRKKAALYEVISNARAKYSSDKRLQQSPKAVAEAGHSTSSGIEGLGRWPTRPRIVQFNAGRVEVSMPYQLVIALLLCVVLLFLVVFRVGQNLSGQKTVETVAEVSENLFDPAALNLKTTDTPKKVEAAVKKAGPVKSGASNRIVIQTLDIRRDLEPVKEYYARFGIQTEIREIGGVYYLVTSGKYQNPERAGTDGYLAKQKLMKVGVNYKAPSGYRSFGTKPFQDAYGMRFND